MISTNIHPQTKTPIKMDIEFITQQQQSLQTLCFHYILNQTTKSRPLLINSIVMHLACHAEIGLAGVFQVCLRIVEENRVPSANSQLNSSNSYSEKEYRKNIASLLKDIVSKCPTLVPKAQPQQLTAIIQYAAKQAFCAVSGNEFINLIRSVLDKLAQSVLHQINKVVEGMMMDPKMTVGTYRQVTRLHLYSILFSIVQAKTVAELSTAYLEKIIRLIEDEKDPRNISLVFEIYLLLLTKSSLEQLAPLHRRLFNNLEMYYPIDFEGDSEKHNIHLNAIADLLDQCLSHPMFASEVRALLMIKMGAAPIAKYIPTFIQCKPSVVGGDKEDREFWSALLLRTGEDGYLEEQYDDNAVYRLPDLISQLLNRLAPKHKPMPLFGHSSVMAWLSSTFVRNILTSAENSKHANTLMIILKHVMGKQKCGKQVQAMIGSYLVAQFINKCKDDRGDVIYKLGMLMPVIDNASCSLDTQKVGLLILTLAQVFHKTDKQEPQPRLMVLKLFMLLAWSPAYMKMIHQTNIIHSCIAELTSKQVHSMANTKVGHNKIIKAYIDFLVELYYTDDKVCQAILNVDSTLGDARVYGLLTLANKSNQQSISALTAMLNTDSQDYGNNFKNVVTVLRTFKPEASLSLLSKLFTSTSTQHQLNQLCELATQKFAILSQQSDNDDHQFMQLMQKYSTVQQQQSKDTIPHVLMWYLLKSAWRPHLTHDITRQYIKTTIESMKQYAKLNDGKVGLLFSRICAFYNWSLKGLKLQSAKLQDVSIQQKQQYRSQIYRMLPIVPDHTYSVQQCKNWPTLTHYSWLTGHSSQNKSIRADLIPLLPPAILAAEGNRILPYILHHNKISTLSKVLQSLSQETIIKQIVPFIVCFISDKKHMKTEQKQQTNAQSTNDLSSENVVDCNKMLTDLLERSKTSEDIHRSLIANKGKILVAIEQNLLQHSKRRVRQSARMVFSIYNALK